MKVLFTADLHLKLGQKNVPVDWQKDRFRKLFQYLNEIVADILVIGGDMFDRLATIEELEFYFELMSSLKHPTIVFPGNHESTKKHQTFLSRLKEVTSRVNPLVNVIDDFYTIENMDFIPYNKLREQWPDLTGNICFTHVRGEIPPHVKPELDLDLFNKWDIVFAGDLHSHENSQRNIVYPGSPLTTSFHRTEVSRGVILLDSDTAEYTFIKLDLPQLIRKTVGSSDLIVPTEYHHTIYELEGELGALKAAENSDLLDKKLVKREYSSGLSLGGNLTIREELAVYLSEVLKIEDIDKVLREADDYIKASNVG